MSLCLCGSSQAALDPQAKEPYRLTVVLHVAPHRLLTPVFKEQLKRELGDSLQAAYGKVAEVVVADDHPLLKEIEKRGLQAVLDGYAAAAEKKPGKTHFVLVDYVDGQYEIQAGQVDSLTGLTSPVVRQVRLDDPAGRPLVARTAAQMVNQDFGYVGTVTKRLDGQKFEVTLKGSRLGTTAEKWAAADEVFAVAQVSRAGSGERVARVEESFLVVVEPPKDGVCVCKLVNRYKTPEAKLTEGPNVLGFRCLKLGTSADAVPLRLRLVDAKGLAQDGLQIEANRTGFDRTGDFKHQGMTRDGGLAQTEETYPHIAFVRVLKQGTVVAQIPVPVIAGRTVVCRVNVNDQAGTLGELNLRKRTCVERMTETLLVQADLRKELGDLITRGKLEDALAKARDGLKGLEADVTDLSTELARVSAAAQKLPAGTRFSLADGEQRLEELRAARADLQKNIGELEDSVTKWKGDATRRALEEKLQAARNLRREARFDEAIDAYKEALAKHGPNAGVQKELDALVKDWELKGDEHREARVFIYRDWPKLNTPQKLRDRMEKARQALAVCKEKGDKLTVQKLGLVNRAHDAMLNRVVKGLRPDVEDDRQTAEVVEKVAGELQKLHQEVLDYLEIKAPAPKDEKR